MSIQEYSDQVKKEAHSVETPLKHGSRGEIFRRFAERRLYLHLSRIFFLFKEYKVEV